MSKNQEKRANKSSSYSGTETSSDSILANTPPRSRKEKAQKPKALVNLAEAQGRYRAAQKAEEEKKKAEKDRFARERRQKDAKESVSSKAKKLNQKPSKVVNKRREQEETSDSVSSDSIEEVVKPKKVPSKKQKKRVVIEESTESSAEVVVVRKKKALSKPKRHTKRVVYEDSSSESSDNAAVSMSSKLDIFLDERKAPQGSAKDAGNYEKYVKRWLEKLRSKHVLAVLQSFKKYPLFGNAKEIKKQLDENERRAGADLTERVRQDNREIARLFTQANKVAFDNNITDKFNNEMNWTQFANLNCVQEILKKIHKRCVDFSSNNKEYYYWKIMYTGSVGAKMIRLAMERLNVGLTALTLSSFDSGTTKEDFDEMAQIGMILDARMFLQGASRMQTEKQKSFAITSTFEMLTTMCVFYKEDEFYGLSENQDIGDKNSELCQLYYDCHNRLKEEFRKFTYDRNDNGAKLASNPVRSIIVNVKDAQREQKLKSDERAKKQKLSISVNDDKNVKYADFGFPQFSEKITLEDYKKLSKEAKEDYELKVKLGQQVWDEKVFAEQERTRLNAESNRK